MYKQISLGVFLTLITLSASADVQLHSMFTDNMVLQQKAPVPVWGMADDGEEITVEFQGQSKTTTAEDGEWKVTLNNLEAGGPHTLTVSGDNTIERKNILVGEVWVCSGQSNMEWHVAWSANPEQEIANANYPEIRFIKLPKESASEPQKQVNANWEVCSPETVADKSAVGYYYGRTLHQALDVPIGLIMTAWGGTPAESWTSEETLQNHPELADLVDRQENYVDQYKQNIRQYYQDLQNWMEEAQNYEESGTNLPYPPSMPSDNRLRGWRTSGLYNAMIAPIIPFRIKGAIWYQGESNADRAYQYRTLFSEMIKDWRKNWGQGAFPFYFVQLANFQPGGEREGTWPELREAQNWALSLPNTGMAVTIDIGNPTDIHPKNKQEVGRRLALDALAKDYDFDVVYSGPMYQSHEIEDGKIRISFDYADSGMVFTDGADLFGFTIAGEDQQFHPANAIIEGKTVLVWSDDVPEPVAVRYAWKDNPEDANLYNNNLLPASPFKTDDWPWITQN